MIDPRTPWPLIALLWATGLLAASQFAKVTLTLDALGQVYAGAPIALAVSGVAVVGILGGAVTGFFVARIGARRAVLGAVAGSGFIALLQGFDMPFAVFMATRILEGFGHLILVVALPTLMVTLARPSDRSVVMGIWATFFGVGFAVLAVIIPVVVAWGGVHAVYVGHGILLLAIFPVLWWALPSGAARADAMANIIDVHRAIYRNPRYFAPGLGHGIYAGIFIALVAYLPPALDAMWLTAVLPLVNLTGTFASGFMARRIAASKLSIGGFGVAGILFVLLGVTGSAGVAMLAMFATGVTAGANFAAVPEFNDTPHDQARANGAMAQIGNVGTFSGTPIYALVAASLWGIVAVSVAICLFGVVFAGLAYRRARMSAQNG